MLCSILESGPVGTHIFSHNTTISFSAIQQLLYALLNKMFAETFSATALQPSENEALEDA